MASTVLPNGIIVPEKYSRDWYNDLYHNWEELDNLLSASTPGDGTLTIQKNGTTVGTFSANQATDETINITVPDVNDATLTIQKNGTDVATFTANASTNATANITVPIKTSDLSNDSGFITEDTSKIPLSGTNSLAGSIVPDTDNSYDFGSSSYKLRYVYCNTAYVTNLNINGTAAGDILTHNASEFVPRSGGAVLSGYDLCRTANDAYLALFGGNNTSNGAGIVLSGADRSLGLAGSVAIQASDNSLSKTMFMYPDGTWTWNGSACVVSSDRRIKDEISEIPDEVLDAWENLEPKQYKLKSDLENDKDNAQVHYGWIAQDVESIIKGDRKGEIKNGLWLHEEWEEQEEVSHEETYTEEVETKSGETETVTKTRKVIDQPYKAKGDSYGLRYTECLVVECKYLRRCIARLTARIEELEKGNKVEEK